MTRVAVLASHLPCISVPAKALLCLCRVVSGAKTAEITLHPVNKLAMDVQGLVSRVGGHMNVLKSSDTLVCIASASLYGDTARVPHVCVVAGVKDTC